MHYQFMKKLYYLFLFTFILSPFLKLKAGHIIGGEIVYNCIGPSGSAFTEYEVIIKVYRDCEFPVGANRADFDDPLRLAVYDNNTLILEQEDLSLISRDTIPLAISDPCLVTLPTVCVEEGIYRTTLTLRNNSSGYTVSYARCCRSPILDNLSQPGTQGITLTTQIPSSNSIICNNSPQFIDFPPVGVCANRPFVFDHSAIDIDGDSLVYEFCSPFSGLSNTNVADYSPPPPYFNVAYVNGFNAQNPLPANPTFKIDSATGLITGTPTQIGNYVVGVCVTEYRNGIILSTVKRDFTINTAPCDPLIISAVQSQTAACDGLTITFNNLSSGSNRFHWDFGVPGILSDTSNLTSPTFTYPDTGTYNITLIAGPGALCDDTSIVTYKVYGSLAVDFDLDPFQCTDTNNIDVAVKGVFENYATFNWDFGSSASIQSSTSQTVNNISYNSSGLKNIKLITTQGKCVDSVEKTIDLGGNAIANFGASVINNCTPVNVILTDSSITDAVNVGYLWDFGDGTTSTLKNPTKQYTTPGSYSISLRIDQKDRCIDTSFKIALQPIDVVPKPEAYFIVGDPQCFNGNKFNFAATGNFNSQATFSWQFGDRSSISQSNSQSNTISYDTTGRFPVQLIVEESGCADTLELYAEVYPNPTIDFVVLDDTICFPDQVQFIDQSTAVSDISYLWFFGNGDTSSLPSPIVQYDTTGIFNVFLQIRTSEKCIDTLYKSLDSAVVVFPRPNSGFISSDTSRSIKDAQFEFIDTSSSWTKRYLSLGDGFVSYDSIVNHRYSDVGFYPVTQIVQNQFSCSDTTIKLIEVYDVFEFVFPNIFTPNGDGINDMLRPIACGVIDYKVSILNRWGLTIFTSNALELGWDGRVDGQKSDSGTYFYIAELKDFTGKSHVFKGTVSLYR